MFLAARQAIRLFGEFCIDPAETAQVRLLMRRPQQVFSCPAPGVGAGGCKSQSSHQGPGWRVAGSQRGGDARTGP